MVFKVPFNPNRSMITKVSLSKVTGTTMTPFGIQRSAGKCYLSDQGQCDVIKKSEA